MVTYSINWMGPISMSWFRDRGLTYTKGGSEAITTMYCGGRIDICGLDEEYYHNGQHEYGLRPMHQDDWNALTDWLRTFKTETLVHYHTIIEQFETHYGKKIRWSQENR
jgi:hypothetical protein